MDLSLFLFLGFLKTNVPVANSHVMVGARLSQTRSFEVVRPCVDLFLSPPEFMRTPCVEAGLIPPLIQLLHSSDQEVLLQTGRALGNICYDSRESDCVRTSVALCFKCFTLVLVTETSSSRSYLVFTHIVLHMWEDPREVTCSWSLRVVVLVLNFTSISSRLNLFWDFISVQYRGKLHQFLFVQQVQFPDWKKSAK